MKTFRLLWCLAVVACVAGCETKPKVHYDRLGLVNAGGRITLDGQPLAGAVVSFDDPTDDTFSYGLTDSGGRFELQLDSVMKGVKPGGKIVRVSTSRKILGLNMNARGDAGGGGRQAELVSDKYNKKSTLLVEVTPGRTSYDFDLKSK